MTYEQFTNIDCYKDVTRERFEETADVSNFAPVIPCETDEDSLLLSIFAPDPFTGFPRSDLFFEFSNSQSDEVRAYIHNNLMKENIAGISLDSADEALEFTKTRLTSLQEYTENLKKIIQNSKQ